MQLEIPNSFGEIQTLSSSETCPAQGQINLNALDYFGAGNIGASKQSYAIASQLFPEAKLLGPRGGLRDGRCDALLIAEWGRRHLQGKI